MPDTLWGLREVDWIGIQAGCAVVGLIVLTAYTVYTRRMMKMAEDTKRAAITPMFSVRDREVFRYIDPLSIEPAEGYIPPPPTFGVSFTIRNVGQGPAILFRAWHQPVSESFELEEAIVRVRTPISMDGEVPQQDLLSGEKCRVRFEDSDLSRPWLFVVESSDPAKGLSQLQMLYRPREGKELGDCLVHHMMVFGIGDSTAERFMRGVTRAVQVLKAMDEKIKSLDDRFDD